MSKENSSGSFMTGFLLGGIVGAVAALLMTPQPGETTRLRLKDSGIELKTQLSGLTSEIQERGKVIIEEKLPSRDVQHGEEPAETTADEADKVASESAEA